MDNFKSEKDKVAYALLCDPSKVEKIYKPSEEEMKIFLQQTSSSEEDANIFFHKNKGNLENAIFDYLESFDILKKLDKPSLVNDEDLLNENISVIDKMETYRNILFHKDKVFQQKFDETSGFDANSIGVYEYVAFQPSTTEYRKLKFKGTKEYFSMEIIRSYLDGEIADKDLYEANKKHKEYKGNNTNGVSLDRELEVQIEREDEVKAITDGKTEEVKPIETTETIEEVKEEDEEIEEPERKIIIKTVVKEGLTHAKKWSCNKPVLAFLEVEDKDKIEENINKLASKFMKACGYFKEGQYIYGPAMLIDNWYL
jgi:hypothetical protein